MSGERPKIVNRKTVHTLYGLVTHKIINLTTLGIFFYIQSKQGDELSYSNISQNTRISVNHIQKHTKALELLGLIHKVQGRRGKSNIYTVSNIAPEITKYADSLLAKRCTLRGKDLAPSHPSYISSLGIKGKGVSKTLVLVLETMYGDTFDSYLEEREKREKDPEWLESKKVLLSYFKQKEVHSKIVISKSRFSKLLELRSDENVDFEEYAKWYKDTKYSSRGFTWGLFLYPAMIEEYKEAIHAVRKVDKYKKTGSAETRKKHDEAAKKSKDQIRRMLDK